LGVENLRNQHLQDLAQQKAAAQLVLGSLAFNADALNKVIRSKHAADLRSVNATQDLEVENLRL
jgi:hypothetical protein